MGFTLRFMLGTLLVLLCSWSIQTAELNRQIRQVNNEDTKSTEKLQKVEVERTTQQNIIANLSEEHSKKPKTDFSTEDNKTIDKQNSVVGKLQKSESFKKATSQPEIKTTREVIGRSIDIEKYISKEFHNKNNVYSAPTSSDTEKYVDSDYEFHGTTHKHREHAEEFNFESELTTPKTSIFDHKYKEAVESVDQKLEHIDESDEASAESESKEKINLETLYEQTKSNDTKADLNYINYTNIIANDTGDKNTLHKDLVVEAGTNLLFNSSYNRTTVIGENDSEHNTIAKEPENEKKVDTSTISNVIPVNGDLEKSESATMKSIMLTTRKSIVLTKPPSNRNSSHISILSNNIETETVKAINIVQSKLETTTEKSKGEKETILEVYTNKTPIDITKRGSVKFAHSTLTQPTTSTNKMHKNTEQLFQENQIVPVHVEPPPTTTTSTSDVPLPQEISRTSEKPAQMKSPIEEEVTVTEVTATLETTATFESTTTEIEPTLDANVTTKTDLSMQTETETINSTETEVKTTSLPDTITTTSYEPEVTTKIEMFTETPSPVETQTNTSSIEETTTEIEMISTLLSKCKNATTTVSPDIETTLSLQTSTVEQETTTLLTMYLDDSTPTETTEAATTGSTTTSEENITTVASLLSGKVFTATTENTIRTSKGLVFTDTVDTTPAVSATTPEISTMQPTTDEIMTTVTWKTIPSVTTDVVTETETNGETNQSKNEEQLTATTLSMGSTSLVPHLKNVAETEFTTELDNTTDSSAVTSDSYELSTNAPEDNSGTIAAIAISSVGAVCLVLLAVLLVVMRKRQKRFNYGQRCTPVSLDDYSMDNVSVYNNSVRRKGLMRGSKRSYGNPAFEDPASISHPLNFPALGKFANNLEDMRAEFEEIPLITARTNELPEGCDTKNRYANVIPLPETRVFLSLIDGYPNSDYINANYVTGPKNTKGYYIACQAPMQNTVDDFWRMIWEQQCKVILMLTHLFENGVEKCVDYLPPSEVLDCHRLFGDFQVTLKKREVKDKYIISILQLKNMVSNSWREVTHFWYMGWPERGIPTEANSLIAFLIEARSYMKSSSLDRKDAANGNLTNGMAKNDSNPVVVHCSPGTGRTGVVIACDIAIREFEQTRLIDVPRIVYKIRRDRASAVQTKEQYAFIYKVINLYATKLTGGALDSL